MSVIVTVRFFVVVFSALIRHYPVVNDEFGGFMDLQVQLVDRCELFPSTMRKVNEIKTMNKWDPVSKKTQVKYRYVF